jgi:hypothetical protein
LEDLAIPNIARPRTAFGPPGHVNPDTHTSPDSCGQLEIREAC